MCLARRGAPGGRPIKLVLLVAVDQFRYDYLTRFRQNIRRLVPVLDTGSGLHPGQSRTLADGDRGGPSTMLTGASPAMSGIVANEWYDRALGTSVTSVSDPDTQLVGSEGPGGRHRGACW